MTVKCRSGERGFRELSNGFILVVTSVSSCRTATGYGGGLKVLDSGLQEFGLLVSIIALVRSSLKQ
jgi:hypothetical protein